MPKKPKKWTMKEVIRSIRETVQRSAATDGIDRHPWNWNLYNRNLTKEQKARYGFRGME